MGVILRNIFKIHISKICEFNIILHDTIAHNWSSSFDQLCFKLSYACCTKVNFISSRGV